MRAPPPSAALPTRPSRPCRPLHAPPCVPSLQAQAQEGDKALIMADLIQTAVTILQRGEALYPFHGLQGALEAGGWLAAAAAGGRGGWWLRCRGAGTPGGTGRWASGLASSDACSASLAPRTRRLPRQLPHAGDGRRAGVLFGA